MTTYRCPVHDLVFDTDLDQRKPGHDGKATSHPDCPICKRDARSGLKQNPAAQPSAQALDSVRRTIGRG